MAKPDCPICGGSGTVQVQKIVNGKVTQVSKPCPSGRCK